MKNNPCLSVIIPCYNNGKLLSEMLDCCIRQTFVDWEVIVVDDGSTDNTPEIVQSYVVKDCRISFYKRERLPKGSLTSRNIGFAHSSGKYIIHFDADDLISDTCFEKRVSFMESHPDLDYATFIARGFVVKNGEMIVDKGVPYGVLKVKGDLLTGFLTTHYPFSIWNNIYRRSSIENYLWDENVKVYSDFSYALPMIFDGLKHSFSGQSEADYYYRQFYSTNNMCASAINEDKCKSTLYLFNKVLSSLELREDKKRRFEEFKEFITLHFERLLLGGNSKDIEDYISMLNNHYDEQFILQLKTVAKRTSSTKGKIHTISVYKWMYKAFKKKMDRTLYIHSLAKLILLK